MPSVTFSLFDGLMMLSIGQTLFVAAVLGLSPRHAEPADRWMAATLLAISLNSIVNQVHGQLPESYDMLANGGAFLSAAAIAPCLWMHVGHITGRQAGPREWRLHVAIMPPMLVLIVVMFSGADMRVVWAAFAAAELLLHGQQAVYLVLAGRRLWRPPGASILLPEDRLRLRWTRRLLLVMIALFLTSLLSQALLVAGTVDQAQERWFDLPIVLGLLAVSVLAFERPRQALASMEAALAPAAPAEPMPEKYRRSGLKAEERADLAARLRAALADPAVLTDPTLSLPRLARMLGALANDVSQAANQELGQSVPDLLAEARIRLAMQRLRDPIFAGRTVLEVALDVGFNAKSTFNAAFKRQTGVTPTAWRDGQPMNA